MAEELNQNISYSFVTKVRYIKLGIKNTKQNTDTIRWNKKKRVKAEYKETFVKDRNQASI